PAVADMAASTLGDFGAHAAAAVPVLRHRLSQCRTDSERARGLRLALDRIEGTVTDGAVLLPPVSDSDRGGHRTGVILPVVE
ncbi:MAG: hypothetical protein KDA89_24045, partial [Planctomycetaceae bacterium]|nr:hypothetical protein [Planctomycetaceae bacterium]